MKGRQLIGASSLLLKSKSVTAKVKRLIYNSIIRPGYIYASTIWGNETAIRQLEVVERKAYQMALNMYRIEGEVKMFSNQIIHEEMGNKKDMLERILEDRERYEDIRERHVNRRVRERSWL